MKKSIRRGVWAAPGTYRGIGQAMASTNRARKTNTKTNTRGSGQRGGRRRAKPKPDMNARWSILLFGIGVLVFALIVVPGASVWNWVRTNILFGVFGGVTMTEAAILCICFGLTMGAELLNTAIERLCDKQASGYDGMVRNAKDIAAAGVFVCAAACVAVGACIFIGNGVLAAAIKFLWYRLWLGMAVVVTVPFAVWFVFHFGRIQ